MPKVPSSASRLLTAVHRHGPLTRAAATERAGLARSAAGHAATQLEAAGLIRSGEQRAVGTGRPSVLLEPAPDGPLALAVKVEATGLRGAAYGLGLRRQGDVVVCRADLHGMPPDELSAHIAQLAHRMLGGDWERCAGLGLAFPGMVDEDSGVVQISLVVGWSDPVDLVAQVHAALPEAAYAKGQLPLTLVRDSTATAIGEYRPGSGALLAVTGERHGMGSALVGVADQAQTLEIGHLCVDPEGPACACGSRGCLELYVGGPALLTALGLDDSPGLTEAELDEQVRAALAAPAQAPVVRGLAEHLATALTGVTNTVGPDEVVFTGMLALLATAAHEQITQALAASVVARVRGTVHRLGTRPDAALAGAAELAFTQLLAHPLGDQE
ncbi:ROK family protein [Streptomyces sp. NPDC059009]|uniref:ROK family protein n=1 Tax=Streptomyces sp. NPDC059009 TaxID=3346694 RepID=UPI003676C3B5